MAKFCGGCGTRMNDNDVFCPNCRRRSAGTVNPVPAQVRGRRNGLKASDFFIIFLCVTLLINISVAGIWYPGLFTKHTEEDEEIIYTSSSSDDTKKDNDDILIGKTSDISVRLTEDEIKNSPKEEVKVSPDNSSVDFGSFHADFSYNLQGEDTFTVTTLPERTDEATGLRIKPYDFSLASGQNEFGTDVVVTVPRDEDDNEFSYWVSYNEDTQKWERIYSKLSEDGKSDLVYTDHFSEKARVSPAREFYEKLIGIFTGNKDQAKIAAKDLRGLFYYSDEINETTKDSYVFMFDPQTFEEYMDQSTVTSLDDIDKIIQETPKDRYAYSSPMKNLFGYNEEPKVGITEADVATAVGGFVKEGGEQLVEIGKLGGKAGQAAAAAGKAGGFVAKGASVIGPVAFVWSGVTLGGKLTNEVAQGKTLPQAIDNHKLDSLSFIVSGIGLIAGAISAPYLAAGCAIAGTGLYVACLINDSERDLSVNESIYREYYTPEFGKARKFYYISAPAGAADKGKVGIIKKIPGLDSADDALLQKIINRYGGLTGYNPRGIASDTEVYKNNPINMEWSLALHALFKVREKKPDEITEIVTKFYDNYVNACFDNGMETYNKLKEDYRKRKGYDEVLQRLVTDEDVKNFKKNLKIELMKVHAPLIKDLSESFSRKAKAGIADLVSDELHDLMNVKMEFRVIDEAVGDSRKDFVRSVYAVDYKSIPGNLNAVEGGIEKYQLPMRFDSVRGPILMPSIRTKEGYHSSTTDDYLMNTDNLIPRYQPGNDNKVFTCRFYHYLNMGLPDFMIFHNLEDKDAKDVLVPIELKEPDKDGVMRITLKVKGQSRSQNQTVALKIENPPFDWDYEESARATVTIDNKLNVTVNIPKGITTETSGSETRTTNCSGFTIKAKADKYARDSYDIDGTWKCYAEVKNMKLKRTYNTTKNGKPYYHVSHSFDISGTVELSCENKHGVIEVIMELPGFEDTKIETEYNQSQYGPKEETHKTKEKGYSLTWTLNNE